jgi:hypothetical protein
MRRLLRRLPAALALAVVIGAGLYAIFAPSWERPPVEEGVARGPLEEGQLRAVTLNAWNLTQAERVPRLLAALGTTASLLAEDDARLPELIAAQELESREAVRALAAELDETHHFVSCECAERGDGRLCSAVAVAASRERFELSAHRCINLGRDWPDHGRCAVEVTLERAGGLPLTVLSVHLPWRWDGSSMARRLRSDASAEGPRVWLGDFNASEGSDAYAELTRAALRDARAGAPPTHYVGRRSDLVLVSRELGVVRGLDRRASFDALGPSSSYSTPWLPYGWTDRRCDDQPADCPLSDHLPEGAVLSF